MDKNPTTSNRHSRHRTRRHIESGLLAACLFALSFAGVVGACQICVPRPTQTLADRLLSSDAVVLARENAHRTYHYAAVEILKGDPGIAAIDLFMNTPVRRRLAADPGSAMLLAHDPQKNAWHTLGIAHDNFERVVRRILSFEGRWIPGETGNLQRLRELASLLGHVDMRLHELAYLELGRAPYRLIQTVGADVSLEKVREMLENPRYLEWRNLGILLLGLSASEQDHARVIREMEGRKSLSTWQNLDAWATAYVEITGTVGIARLQRWYFRDLGRSRDELRNIVRALSVHAANNAELREQVVAAYRDLLDNHPLAAPDITRDLIAWQQWDLSQQLQRVQPLIANNDPLGAYAVKLYLQRAEAHSRPVKK